MSPPYLLDLPRVAQLPKELDSALADVERQFDTPTQKLKDIVDQMLWEFGKGLGELPTDETRDTFMHVRSLASLVWPIPHTH
ncbi:hypothetical protein Rhopal_003568-T1 [Rhodotorula paludigena]|uniref:Uncharacterized protein n=1 Tax=Rhodotorula paludigena TaxID=86838 RepID=A0AAV5GDD9_9BASI|nr:hypothetical protein Rhopal_003568-T1 [Rhodotorula paludigena]